MINDKHTASIKILMVFKELEENTAVAHAVRNLREDLVEQDVRVIVSDNADDATAALSSDPSIQCVLLKLEENKKESYEKTKQILNALRTRNKNIPVFLMASRETASDVPTEILDKVNDFIWILEDTADFISGRIMAAIHRYREFILPPMFQALARFSKIHEYSWHTPGHTGGTAFLKSPAGRAFFNFFEEPIFRSDLSISVGELGSLLDHSGPIGESEKYMAHVFGAHRSYHVTNGSSTSNRVILMASVTRNQIALCDRNCHKSVEHAMTMSGAIPVYLVPSRNQYGIIGPIFPEKLSVEAVSQAIHDNPLIDEKIDPKPVHAIITNSTYDGLCYCVTRVKELLGQSVDRLHFDEAWYGYARFNPLYENRFAMCGDPQKYGADEPTLFSTQSTHKLLAAFSQASMIHVRDGRNPISPERFNEAFMMHASTSPFYPIIASNDISAAMMDGPSGKALTDDSIREAVSFRKTVARLYAEFTSQKDWFFNVWQPDFVTKIETGEKKAFFEMPDDELTQNPTYWFLQPDAPWHGFGPIEEGYCLLDPIKVSVITPGMGTDGKLQETGIPAAILTAYLDNRGIVVEKTGDFTVLFLFSLGVTKGKWGTLLNALFAFKRDYEENVSLERILPKIVSIAPEKYQTMGLKDLADEMFRTMSELQTTRLLGEAFSLLPKPDYTPVEAYENLVHNKVEPVLLKDIAERTVATGVVPYPPGIPLLMPGENVGMENSPILGYLKALEAFDKKFPGFTHDTHGVEVNKDGLYQILCLKEEEEKS